MGSGAANSADGRICDVGGSGRGFHAEYDLADACGMAVLRSIASAIRDGRIFLELAFEIWYAVSAAVA
jgi:hypothetical protein